MFLLMRLATDELKCGVTLMWLHVESFATDKARELYRLATQEGVEVSWKDDLPRCHDEDADSPNPLRLLTDAEKEHLDTNVYVLVQNSELFDAPGSSVQDVTAHFTSTGVYWTCREKYSGLESKSPAISYAVLGLDAEGIDELLESISVLAPGMWENDDGPKDWYAVATNDGIVAYFGDERDALRWRLDLINRRLNG